MAAGWSVFKRVQERQLFVYVPGGWIFSLGGRWSYAVNAAQRAELLARMMRINRWRAVWLILAAAVFAVILAATARLSDPDPGLWGWLKLFAITAMLGNLVVVVYQGAMPYIQWIILRPVLVGASPAASPPAPAPISFWESMLTPVADLSYSTRTLAIFSAVFALLTATYVYDAFTSNGNFLMTVLAGYLTLQYGAGLWLRLRAKQLPEA
jgi:hypothetical protein